MFQKVTVKQLISILLDCDLNSYVEVCTDNKDSEGMYHDYEFAGVDEKPIMDGLTGELYTKIRFYNRDFERDNTAHWTYGEDNLETGTGNDGWFCSRCGHFEFWDYGSNMESTKNNLPDCCPNCGARMIEREVKDNG